MTTTATHRKKLGRIGYWTRLYKGLRRANRAYSRHLDMAGSPFPRVIQLQTINACQAACKMCPYPAFKDVFARGRMDVEQAGRELDRRVDAMLEKRRWLLARGGAS